MTSSPRRLLGWHRVGAFLRHCSRCAEEIEQGQRYWGHTGRPESVLCQQCHLSPQPLPRTVAKPEAQPDMEAYWRRPSVWCACGLELSDVVGELHAKRLSHRLLAVRPPADLFPQVAAA